LQVGAPYGIWVKQVFMKTDDKVLSLHPVKEIQPIADCGNPENHVLAGDILAPNNTRVIKELILDFISRLQ
jgi:hypothetical protein